VGSDVPKNNIFQPKEPETYYSGSGQKYIDFPLKNDALLNGTRAQSYQQEVPISASVFPSFEKRNREVEFLFSIV